MEGERPKIVDSYEKAVGAPIRADILARRGGLAGRLFASGIIVLHGVMLNADRLFTENRFRQTFVSGVVFACTDSLAFCC